MNTGSVLLVSNREPDTAQPVDEFDGVVVRFGTMPYRGGLWGERADHWVRRDNQHGMDRERFGGLVVVVPFRRANLATMTTRDLERIHGKVMRLPTFVHGCVVKRTKSRNPTLGALAVQFYLSIGMRVHLLGFGLDVEHFDRQPGEKAHEYLEKERPWLQRLAANGALEVMA